MSDKLKARHCRGIAEAIEATAAANPAWTWAAAQSVYGVKVWVRTGSQAAAVDPAELADDVELQSVEWLDCDAIASAEFPAPWQSPGAFPNWR